MATEASTLVERIKQKVDIVEEIGAVVALRKSGKAFKGLCPFHGERTPSFYVFPEKQDWRCFGCNEGGDIFTFVQKQQGLDFREALAILAERAGIPLDHSSGGQSWQDSAETSERKRLRALNEAAAIWFHHRLLQSPEAQYCRSYLDSRGVTNDSIALWRLGYAPEGDALSRYLLEQGYKAKELEDAGLARQRDESRGGGLYDYFRNRLIFPIRDSRGQTIAFGGRELGGGHPKYLNTPQTALFDKSATLFGIDLAREGIRRGDRVVIVEGYMDAVVTHQFGTRNVVACIGSAITDKHIRQIKKLTRRVTLALDPDAAGESATLRGITVAQQAFDKVVVPVPGLAPESTSQRRDGWATKGKRGEPRGIVRFEEQVDAEITVARLPAHEDPDEFARRDPEGWRRAIEEAQPLIDYLIDSQTSGLSLETPQGKMEAFRRLLPYIAEVRDRTLADEYADRLARRLRLDVHDVQRDLHATRRRLDREARAASRPGESAESENPVDQLGGKYHSPERSRSAPLYSGTAGATGELLAEQAQAEYCVGLLLERPATLDDFFAILEERDFMSAELRALYAAFIQTSQEDGRLDAETFVAELPEELREAALRVRERVTPGVPEDGQALAKVASNAAYRLKRMRLKAEMAELDYLVREAQSTDTESLRALMARKQQLLTQRRAIDAASRLYG